MSIYRTGFCLIANGRCRQKNILNKGIEHFGKIDIVVNNAGISGAIVKTHELTEDEERFKKTIDVNLMGPFYGGTL